MNKKCSAEKCSKPITGAHANRKYCSDRCLNREKKRRWREKQRIEVLDPATIKRGDAYHSLVATPKIVELIEAGELTHREAAMAIGVGRSTFSEDYATYLMDRSTTLLAETWEMDDEVKQMLAISEYDFDPINDDIEEWLDAAVEAFVRFRNRFFKLPKGKVYITKSYHRAWIRSVLKAIMLGGRQCILSPPRHGKSELLVHFVDWLIARDPEFRIVWIGPNEPIAKIMVGAVKKTLESNTELIRACLAPGETWAPTGRNKTAWGTTTFTVANRDSLVENKAPSLVAIGRGGKVLSLDVDLLVLDDIEDYDSTKNETNRSGTRNWMFNNVESRKEEHTAWLVIGSRQHPDDVYGYLIEDPEWDVIVDSAHSETCALDPEDENIHIECMLFPEVRTYRWLMGKLRTSRAQGLESNYEMVYLNDPRPQGMIVFSADRIDLAKNHRRGIGLDGMREAVARELGVDQLNVNYHLVAGLDPSATGFQVGFLWGFVRELNKLYVIDIDNRQGGGIYAALELMVRWHEMYGLKHWVWENNIMTEADLLQNSDVRRFYEMNDVYLEPHNTQGSNRNVPAIGVGAMSGLYASDPPLVDIPWGSEEARSKSQLYVNQMVKFVETADGMSRVKRKTDVLMASWFPMKAIRRFRKEHQASAEVGAEYSYQGFDATEWDEVPW
jgi:hypothetical protein